MSRLAIFAGLVPMLVTSVTVAQDQVAAKPVFTLTGTGGVMGFQIPTFDTGVFGHTAGGTFFGGVIAGNITVEVGKVNDSDLLISLSGFGSQATGMSNWTDTFTGPGTVIITGLSTPANGDSIALVTTTDPITANISNSNPQGGGSTANASATGNTNNVAFVAPGNTGNSFILGALATGAPGIGGAYGAIADTSGGIFIATGDIDGLVATTSVRRDIFYGGADLSLGLAGQLNETTSAQLYAGPSYRGLRETDATTVSVNIAELAPTATIFPEFTLSHVDHIDSNYFGGVLGGNIQFAASQGVLFTLGLEGGVYAVNASWTGQDTYSTCCGNFAAGRVAPVVGPSPVLLVVADPSTSAFGATTAIALRGSGAVTLAIDSHMAVTFGGNVEYLSQVAQVDHSGLTQVMPGQQDATWVSADGTPATTTLSWGSMINFTLSASLTGTF